jgi:hypothetical protein
MIYQEKVYFPTGQDVEHGEGPAQLYCLDPTRRDDVSAELLLGADGQPAEPDRYHAASSSRQLLDRPFSAWKSIVPPAVSSELRAMFQQAGVELPDDASMKLTNLPGVIWQVDAEIAGVALQWHVAQSKAYRATEPWIKIEQVLDVKVVPNPNSAVIWKYESADRNQNGKIEFEETMHRAVASPVIKNGLLIQVDFSGLVHCLDADTGEAYWAYDTLAACWFTPLIAGQRVYVPDEDGDVAIFRLSKSREEALGLDPEQPMWAHEINMGNSIYGAPTVANGVLYIATRTHLFAIAQ